MVGKGICMEYFPVSTRKRTGTRLVSSELVSGWTLWWKRKLKCGSGWILGVGLYTDGSTSQFFASSYGVNINNLDLVVFIS